MKNILLVCIRFYRRFLSPLKIQPTCIYIPTCSEYAAQAIEKYGSFKGTYLAAKRLLRCHPFARGGFDPVP